MLEFDLKMPYEDPVARIIEIEVKGYAEVVSRWERDEKTSSDVARAVINMALIDGTGKLSAQRLPYKDLPSAAGRLAEACSAALRDKEYDVKSFTISSIGPSEQMRRMLEQQERMEAMRRMTPEELMRRQQEALAQAQAAAARMTPEERAQAEEKAQQMMAQHAEEHRRLMAEAEALRAGNAPKAAPAPSMAGPKFCPNCGSPAAGAKFCSNCGFKLR